MFSDELTLKHNTYVCFPGHVGPGAWGPVNAQGKEATAGQHSCPMGTTFSLKSEAQGMTIKKEGTVHMESGKELKQLLRGSGRPPSENRGRKSRTCCAMKVK